MTAGRDQPVGGKRAAILDAAIDRFGRDGYEHTKWADIAADEPRLTARAVLGIYNSIWLWYRPAGRVDLDRIASFFRERIFALLGVKRGADDGLEAAA